MLKHFFIIICVIAVSALPVRAQELRLLPEYTPCTYEGARYACYDFESQKKLNLLEKRALTWKIQRVSADKLVLVLSKRIDNLNQQLKATDEMIQIQSDYAQDNRAQLLKEIKLKNDWRAKAEKVNIWPWVIGGTLGLLGLGLGLGVFLAK